MNDKEITPKAISTETENGKKFWMIVTVCIVLGIITGFLVSIYYLNDANEEIVDWNERMEKWSERWSNFSKNHNTTSGNWSSVNSTWWNSDWNNNTDNQTSIGNNSDQNSWNSSLYDPYLRQLSFSDVLLPTFTCILLTIVSYILLTLNFVYIKIYRVSKSKYIQGLLLVLIPLLIFSCFMIRVVKSLYFSSALSFNYINIIFGFGIEGLGTLIILLTSIEIIGLTILLKQSIT